METDLVTAMAAVVITKQVVRLPQGALRFE
jgi:hypothetical protein